MKFLIYPRFTIIYSLLCLLIIVSGHFELTWTYYLTKPLALVVVLIFFRLQPAGINSKLFRNLMTTGFIFSATGDFFLMFTKQNEYFFIAGLIAFLLTHLCYTFGFIDQIFSNRPWKQHWGQLAFSTLLVVYGAEFFIINRASFGDLMIPVLIYIFTISSMGIAAVMRDRYKYVNGYYRVLAGALFFITSDSLLAINKFISPFEESGIIILVTYFLAQYFIATGSVIDNPNNFNISSNEK